MKKLLLLFGLVSSLNQVWAQKINADSLVNVVIARNRSAKVAAPISLDSLINAFSATMNPVTRTRLVVDILLGNHGVNGNPMNDIARKLLLRTRKEKDEVGEAIATTIVGYTIYNSGDNAAGLKEMFKGLKLAENKDDKEAIGIIYNLLGVCTTNNTLSKLYYKKGLSASGAAGDKLSVGFELGNLYYVFTKEHNPDSAQYYVLKSFELAVNNNFNFLLENDLLNLGKSQSDPKVKLKYFRAVLNSPDTKSNPELMARATGAISLYYQQTKQIDSALYYARKAFDVSNSMLIGRKLVPAGTLAALYKGRNADSALKYTEISYALRDSMYNLDKIEHAQSVSLAEQQKQEEIAAQKAADRANLRLYILAVVIGFLLLLAFVFWRNNRQNKKAKARIQNTLDELKVTQQQLIQSEKMASLGELTAGIAHEIQNPLNFVNNFSEVSIEMLDEMKLELKTGNQEEAISIANDIEQNLAKIIHHGKRADGIVKGMLQHSRASSDTKEPTDINKLADEYLRLAYHGLRAKDKSFNAGLVTRFDTKLPAINTVPQDVGRVLLNLFTNAFYAVQQKQKMAGADYKPIIELTTALKDGFVRVTVKDNGNGIPENIKEKIMQPFFTTKPTGEGTGLGLSMSYDIIVRAHGGSISVDTKEGEFTAFTVALPVNQK
jgi:two-component system NtrC family sensor kinase